MINGVFNGLFKLFLAVFRLTIFRSKFLRWLVAFLYFFFIFFCHASAKLAPKHWTIIVIENIANFRFRSSTVGSRVYLLSRLVPVLNDTRWLA